MNPTALAFLLVLLFSNAIHQVSHLHAYTNQLLAGPDDICKILHIVVLILVKKKSAEKVVKNNTYCVVKQLPTRGLRKDLYFTFFSYETYKTFVIEVTLIILTSNDIRYNIRLKVSHLVLMKPY